MEGSFLLLGRQFLLLVFEHNTVVHFVLLGFDVFEAHRVSFRDPLHHFLDVPRTNGVIIASGIEHVICEGKGDYAIIVAAKLLNFFHFGPFVDSDLSVVATRVKVVVAKFKSQHPASQAFNQLLVNEFLNNYIATSGASGS